MKKLKECVSLVLILLCCVLLSCNAKEIDNKFDTLSDETTPKPGFFSGFKNFFRGSPTTTTTPNPLSNANRPSLVISQAPLMPIGPRPDTPLSSSVTGFQKEPPQFPGISTTTTLRSQSPALPQSAVSNVHNANSAQTVNFPAGNTNFRQPNKQQPSGFDLSYGGLNSGDRRPQNGKPNSELMPLSTVATSTTTVKPNTSEKNYANPSNEDFPALRRPSIGSHDNFPALPTPKGATSTPTSASHVSSSSAWSLIPARPSAVTPTPSSTGPSSASRPNSPTPNQHPNGNHVSFIPSSRTSSTVRPSNQDNSKHSIASDDEIRQLTETLYTKEVNSQLGLIQVNIQGKTRSIDQGDEAPKPLLSLDERALQAPTISKLRVLFNNYEVDTMVNEHVTPNERREENDFLDAVMATSVMRQAMLFLQNKGLVTPDPKSHRDLVKDLWFTQYSRGRGKIGSSGFEHVFVNEVKNGTIIGFHNWVYFYEEEKDGRLDYKGYLKELDLGTKAKVLKVRFSHNGLTKPVNTIFIGSSPELELALYTICHQLRADESCPVSLGNTRFNIITYSWRYRGKNLIGSAYPEI